MIVVSDLDKNALLPQFFCKVFPIYFGISDYFKCSKKSFSSSLFN